MRPGAKKWPHKDTARHLYEQHRVPSWWCQMVTVEYERERGLLEVRQKLGGEIEITTATKDKSIRAKWGGGKSRVIAMFCSKGPEKSQVTVDHIKLMSAKECANVKIHWFSALNRLQKTLGG